VEYRHIQLDLSSPVGRLRLHRPEARNAMSSAMGAEIVRAVAAINDAPGLRVLLVGGSGKGFSSGGDFALLEERARDSAENNRLAMRRFYDLYLSIVRVAVPTIAVIHGAALGAGLCFALACDLRVAAESATMGLNFVRVGLHPGMAATHLLPRLVGPAVARELLYTGRVIDAGRALSLGVVNEVCPEQELEQRALALAEEIAAAAPGAVRRLKRTLTAGLVDGLERSLELEAEAQADDYRSEDLAEAIRAFREKRQPVFHGR
jgi:enoyl-CoA hydratase